MFINHDLWVIPSSTVPKLTLLSSVSLHVHSVRCLHKPLGPCFHGLWHWWVGQFLVNCRVFWCVWLEVLPCAVVYTTTLWLDVVRFVSNYGFPPDFFWWGFIHYSLSFNQLFFVGWDECFLNKTFCSQSSLSIGKSLQAFLPWSMSAGIFWYGPSGVLQ